MSAPGEGPRAAGIAYSANGGGSPTPLPVHAHNTTEVTP